MRTLSPFSMRRGTLEKIFGFVVDLREKVCMIESIMTKTTNINMNTQHIELTELLHDSQYNRVGQIINEEDWSRLPLALSTLCASYFS